MVNHVVLVGNLGSDPEVRAFGDHQKVTRLSVATHEVLTKRSGERERQTEWHQVVAWAALGERAAQQLRKGRSVLVEGRLQTRVWADARGTSTSPRRSAPIEFCAWVAATWDETPPTRARAVSRGSVRGTRPFGHDDSAVSAQARDVDGGPGARCAFSPNPQ